MSVYVPSPIYLSIYPSVHPSMLLSIYPSMYIFLSVYLYICLPVYLYICMSVCLYVCIYICIYIYINLHLFLYLYLYRSLYLCLFLYRGRSIVISTLIGALSRVTLFPKPRYCTKPHEPLNFHLYKVLYLPYTTAICQLENKWIHECRVNSKCTHKSEQLEVEVQPPTYVGRKLSYARMRNCIYTCIAYTDVYVGTHVMHLCLSGSREETPHRMTSYTVQVCRESSL